MDLSFLLNSDKKTVKRNAFDYAKTLLEIIENLSQEEITIEK